MHTVKEHMILIFWKLYALLFTMDSYTVLDSKKSEDDCSWTLYIPLLQPSMNPMKAVILETTALNTK